jgi:probable phosphoglycerate mutase
MLLDRVRPWFEELEKPTICVTHGGVLRILFRLIEDLPVADVATMEIVQDRVLRLEGSKLEWL